MSATRIDAPAQWLQVGPDGQETGQVSFSTDMDFALVVSLSIFVCLPLYMCSSLLCF